MSDDVAKARTITLDELITTASRSSFQAYRELIPKTGGKVLVPPKIWVGIWIDPSELFGDLASRVGNA